MRWLTLVRPRLRQFLRGSLAFAVMVGCASAPSVKTSYDHAVNFASYRTFVLAHPNRPVPESGGVDPFVVFRLRQMVFSQLSSQGYGPASSEAAELEVWVSADALTRTEVISGGSWGPYHPGYGYGADVRDIEVLRLKVDLVDAARKTLIWHGSAEISDPDPGDEAELWRLVQAVVQAFPPRAPSD